MTLRPGSAGSGRRTIPLSGCCLDHSFGAADRMCESGQPHVGAGQQSEREIALRLALGASRFRLFLTLSPRRSAREWVWRWMVLGSSEPRFGLGSLDFDNLVALQTG